MSSKYRIEPNLIRGGASAGRIGRDENETIRFYLMIISIRFDSIRFDSMKLFIACSLLLEPICITIWLR